MTTTPVFQIRNLEHFYDGRLVLAVEDLSIQRGSITGLMGPNGSGKSTLLKLLAHAEAPTSGEILFNGRPEAMLSKAVRFNITLLTQKPYLLKRTVIDNLIYGLKIRNDTRNATDRAGQALVQVGLDPGLFFHRKWNQLSGGEAQRAALAARLILKPQALLMDEPTASVDADSAVMIRNAALEARNQWGTTLIIASHDLLWLSEISDTLLHLHQGHLFPSGMANVIPGPWAKRADGCFSRKLRDGQTITVSNPPHPEATALIPGSLMLLANKRGTAHNCNHLTGTIKTLLLEKRSGYIMAGITIGELQLSMKLDAAFMASSGMYPGKEVSVSFDPDAVTWL